MVGILEPQYRVGQIQGQVVRADSAAKSLIPEIKTSPVVEDAKKVEEVLEKEAEA